MSCKYILGNKEYTEQEILSYINDNKNTIVKENRIEKVDSIYINKDTADDSVLLHEYNHLFNSWLKENRKELYEKGIDLVKKEVEKGNSDISDIISYVRNTQPDLKGEAFYEEILTELTGRRGAELLNSKKKSGIIDWIREAFKEIGKMLGLLEATPEQVSKMTLKDFADASAVQMLKGENFVELYDKASKFNNLEDFIDSMSDFRDAHSAPSKDTTPTEDKLNTGGDFSLEEVAKGFHNQPDDYYTPNVGARYYGYNTTQGMESFTAINNIIRGTKAGKDNQTITAYRAVPNGVEINELKDYDWVTFSKTYAKNHGESRFGKGEYKIVKQEVPITDLWWDGNDINEWGYDTGNTKKYSRKELKDIWGYTKDNEKSFQQPSNIRFQIIGEKGASRIQEYQNLLDQAKELEAKGEDYSQTGWYKGLDGWKYLSKEVIENFKIVNKEENKVLKLKEVLGDENILFTIYPEMQEVSVVFLNENKQGYEKFKPIDKDTAGEFNPSDETIRINIFYQGNERTLEEVQYTLGHEVSHYGQRLEGFSRGGNQQTVLQEALDILNIEGEGRFLGQIRKEISEADKSNLTQNQSKIVEDSLKTINALMTRNINVLMYQYKRLMGEIDANIVGELVTKGTATGTYADLLSMYLNRENIDPESIYYISGNQIQFSLIEPITTKVTEPNLSFETPSGETISSYQEALQKTEKGKIKLNIEGVNVGEVDSDTNLDTFEGTINHLVKSGGLTGRRYIDKNGEVVFETNGKSDTAKQLTANLVEEQVAKLLGQRNIKRLKNGDFILKEGLNKITINGEEFNKKDIDALDFTQLTKKFGRETALRVELMREYSKALQPTKTKKRLEEVEELKTEDELVTSIKSLLNKLGVKITSIEDYIKHNKSKNNDVDPSANALMDVVNKIMAFKNGVITREDLIEETMHLIEATLDPRTTEGIRRNIDKTEEWKQYSEQYFEIYSKEYSGEKLDEMVRREILGKVMANAVTNNFTLEENASLAKQSIFSRIKELLQQFFDRINAYFKPEYQQQIDALNNDIYAKLMSGTLYSEMNLDQNFGTKFRLYSTSNNIANDIVLLQKQAEKALDVLSTDKKTGVNKSAIVKAVRDVLGHSAEKLKNAQEREAKVELIKSFSQIVNMSQRQVNYLETALKKAEANKHPFSAEEMAVYMNLVNQFDANILPTVVETIKKQKILTNAEKKIVERIEKLQKDINVLKGKVGSNGFNAKDYTVRMLVERLGLDAETEKFLQEQVNSTQQEANWFFIQFGNLSHSSNIFLNALGHVITKTDYDKRQGFMEDIKPFIEKLANLDFLKGTKLSEFVRGNYIQSAHNFETIETAILDKKYELYQSVIKSRLSDTTLSKEDRDNLQAKIDNLISKEEFAKIEVFDDLDVKTDQEIKRQLDIWQLETFKLSPFYADEYATKREKLGQYSDITQSYIAQRSAEYSSIYEMAETINGKQVVTADMKYRFEQLKKEEVQAKDVFDTEGEFKKGLYPSDSSDPNAIEISKNFFVGIDRAVADDFAKLAFELNQIAKERLELAKSKNQGNEFSQEFEDILRSMNSEEAYEFLTLNAYLTYTQEYYDTFNRESLVDRLENAKDGENDADIDAIIQDIQINTKKINNIIQANKVMNNPSEVNFDGMDASEKTAVKEYSERLDFTYQKARKYLPKTEESEQGESITEVKPNRAFFDYLFDKNPNVFESGIVPDFTEIDILSADDIIKANKVFSEIIEHTTENKKREILDLKREVERFSKGTQTKFNRLHQRVFSITEEDLKMMSEEEIYSTLTKDLLKYSYSKLLPYFKKTQPINADIALQDLEAGKITPSEFIDNYKNGKYEYLQISPNFNFQDATEVNNRNPEFEFAKANGTPMYRVFEKGVQESDLVGKSVEQLINEGKINKFIDKEYFEEYGIDLVKLLNGEEVATKNTQKFEARKALIDLQKVSLEKNGVLGRHNLYQLPQKEKSQTRKLDDFFSQGKSLKSLFDELKNFREDDVELGQGTETDKYGRTISNIDNISIPKHGIRKLKDSPVTDDLLESYVWMNFKANEHKARKENYQDAFNIGIAAFGDDFGYKTSAEAGNNYKMFKEAMDYNFYGIKEVWSYKVKTGIFGEFDAARLLQNFGKWIRFRNLAYTLISPITSMTTGMVQKKIESLIGENIDKDAEKVANKFFIKHASEASLEILSLESKTVLNSLGELYGWYEPLERYENTMYSKAVRGLGQSAFAAHQLANFPVNTRVGLSVLANHRFFEGKLLEYREYKKLFPGKSDRDIRETWRQQTSVLDVVKLESDGRISYDYIKISESLNNNFTEQEAKEFMDTKNASLIRGRIKSAIQRIDGQISEEDRSMSTRNVFFSFVNIHRSWLFLAIQNRFKNRQFNTQTGRFEEGSLISIFSYFRNIIKSSKQKGFVNTLSNVRKDFDSYDEVTKRNVKRTLYELAVLNAFVALTAMALRELEGDDDDSYLFKVSTLMLIRTTNELASSSVALHKNLGEMIDNVVVGTNSIEIVTQSPDIFSSDIVSRGRFRGMTERERYMFRQIPIMRDYWNIYSDVEGNIKSYNYFNFVKQGNLDYTIYPFFQEEEK